VSPSSIATYRPRRFWFLAPFLGQGRVVGIPFDTAAVVGERIVGIEGGAGAEPLRQVRVGDKLAPKGDQIRLALLKPCLGTALVEATEPRCTASIGGCILQESVVVLVPKGLPGRSLRRLLK